MTPVSAAGRRLGVALALSFACSGAALAGEPVETGAAAAIPRLDIPAAAAQPEIDLDAQSGRGTTAVALTAQDLTAVNTGNTVQADVVGSGAISLQGNALGGFAGMGNFVMNTGHNNNLQSTLSVTIVVTQ